MILTKNIKIAFFVFVALSLAILFFQNFVNGDNKIREIRSLYIVDMNNNNKLVEVSDNIFIGKVLEKTGNKKYGGGNAPQTQFKVQVIENIKGDLKGNVEVHQEAGYLDGYLVIEKGSKLLKPGNVYLMATSGGKNEFGEEVKYALIGHRKGMELIASNEKVSTKELKEIIDKNKRVLELKQAYKENLEKNK